MAAIEIVNIEEWQQSKGKCIRCHTGKRVMDKQHCATCIRYRAMGTWMIDHIQTVYRKWPVRGTADGIAWSYAANIAHAARVFQWDMEKPARWFMHECTTWEQMESVIRMSMDEVMEV